MTAATQAVAPAQLQSRFLALLPRIEAHARVHFRHVRCRDRKEDFAALCQDRGLTYIRNARAFVSSIEDRSGVGEKCANPVDHQAFQIAGRYPPAT